MTRVKWAKAGQISGDMRDIARKEYLDPRTLLEGVTNGSIAVRLPEWQERIFSAMSRLPSTYGFHQ